MDSCFVLKLPEFQQTTFSHLSVSKRSACILFEIVLKKEINIAICFNIRLKKCIKVVPLWFCVEALEVKWNSFWYIGLQLYFLGRAVVNDESSEIYCNQTIVIAAVLDSKNKVTYFITSLTAYFGKKVDVASHFESRLDADE